MRDLPAEYAIIREALDQECTRTYAEGLAALDRLAAREVPVSAPPAAECTARKALENMPCRCGDAGEEGYMVCDRCEALATPCQHSEAQSEIARLRAELEHFESSWATAVREKHEMMARRDHALDELRRAVDALRPFEKFFTQMIVPPEDYSYMRERIADWFGVSEFKKAAESVAAYDAKHGEKS